MSKQIRPRKLKHALTDCFFSPVITEKSMALSNASTKNVVVFLVDHHLDKLAIKKGFEKTFGVKVASVRTMIVGGTAHDRTKLRRKAGVGLKKKVIISLKEGENFFLGEL